MENQGLAEGGLLPRFLFVDTKAEAEDEPRIPYEMDRGAVDAWAELIRASLEFRRRGATPVVINADDEARELLRTFTNKSKRRTRKGGDLVDVAAFPNRWGEQAWKVAYASTWLAEHGAPAGDFRIGGETALAAIEVVEWFARQQLLTIPK